MRAQPHSRSALALVLFGAVIVPACAADVEPGSLDGEVMSSAQNLDFQSNEPPPDPELPGSLSIYPTSEAVPCVEPAEVAIPTPSDQLTVAPGYEETVYESSGGKEPTLVLSAAPTKSIVTKTSLTTTTSGTSTTGLKGSTTLSSGSTTSSHDGGGLGYVAVPGSCQEEAVIQFGQIPHGMPLVKWPEMNWCDSDQCRRVSLAWMRTHHSAWRLAQMFEFMADMPAAQRQYAWDQPGVDASGEPGHKKSRPSYWFGPYTSDRFATALETVRKYWDVVSKAKTGNTNIRLQCPSPNEQPNNPCITAAAFGVDAFGTHWTKGYINVCPAAFANFGSGLQDGIDATVHHEPLHWVFTHYDGVVKALTDTKTHWHGNSCAGSPDTDTLYFKGIDDDSHDELLEHFTEYNASDGGTCSHRTKVLTSVDAYAQFARAFGTLVLEGDIVNWPKWGDPTPQPPQCVGDIGCLCDEVPSNEYPDGDYSETTYCDDNEVEPTVCMKTKFNASSTVGICTNCADVRGPGCPCEDLTQPCDEGFCWGDDTGPGNVTGTCYHDPPPHWGCLANCEALLGNGAFCMADHPGGARCVPYGTALPDAYNCWIYDEGYIDADGDCSTHECGPAAEPANTTCQDLGYPEYFVCGDAFRCIPNP